MMLRDVVSELYYHGNGHNFSCSEAMIRAIDRYYELHLPQELFYSASGFSGGCRHDEMCGGVASCVSALGILYSRGGHAHDSLEMLKLRNEFFQRFDERFGPYRCEKLKERYHDPDRRCESILIGCADIFEEMVAQHAFINQR